MSFTKNKAITGFTFSLINATTGAGITSGAVSGYYLLDGGTQGSIADTPVHEGVGSWSVDLSAAECNGNVVGLLFTHTSAVPKHFCILTNKFSFPKNTAITGFPFAMISKTDGSAITAGDVDGYVTLDGGVQAAISDEPVHKGNGQWCVDIATGETNGTIVGLTFTHADAIPIDFTFKTIGTGGTYTATAEHALYHILVNDGTVSGLVGTDIYPQMAPQDTDLPYAIYNIIARRHMNNMAAASGQLEVGIQVDWFAAGIQEVMTLCDAAREAIDGYTNGTVTVGSDTITISRIKLEDERDGFEIPTAGESLGVYHRMQDYTVWCTESIPTFA